MKRDSLGRILYDSVAFIGTFAALLGLLLVPAIPAVAAMWLAGHGQPFLAISAGGLSFFLVIVGVRALAGPGSD